MRQTRGFMTLRRELICKRTGPHGWVTIPPIRTKPSEYLRKEMGYRNRVLANWVILR